MADHTGGETKDRAREATDAVTGDRRPEREGKIDRAGAPVKDRVGDASDAARDAVNSDRRR